LATLSVEPEERRAKRVGLVVGCSIVGLGCLCILEAYREASAGDTASQFTVFWIGMALVWGTLAVLAFSRRLTDPKRSLLLVALGLAAYLPAFIRDPSTPMFYDEDGHYAQAASILRTGRLFLPNGLVPMASKYPGLHTLTVPLVFLSSLSLVRVGTILLAIFHVLSVAGIYVIAKTIYSNPRIATVAALLYAISPAISFFDSQYAYESFAIPLAIWALALLFHAGTLPRRRALPFYGLSLLLGCCLAITHHFTTYATVALILFYAALLAVLGKRSRSRRHSLRFSPRRRQYTAALTVGGITGLVAVGWILLLRIPIWSYLAPFPEQGFHQIAQIVTGTSPPRGAGGIAAAGGGARQLFQNSGLPSYEKYAAYLVPPLLLVAFLVTAVRHRQRRGPEGLSLAALALLYFATLPLDITGEGQSLVHRSWAFSWIGMSCLAAPGLIAICERAIPVMRRLHAPRGLLGRTGQAGLFGLVVVVLQIGNYGGNVNSDQMFPGSFIMEADGRTTQEQMSMAQWFARHEGYGRVVMADQRNFEVLVAYSDALPSSFPAWELYFPTTPPPTSVVSLLYKDRVQFVLVDKRLATDYSSFLWFGNFQPDPPSDPLPLASIRKFGRLPYLRKVHQINDLILYQVIPDREASGSGEPRPGAK
jgi:hypothetical protein